MAQPITPNGKPISFITINVPEALGLLSNKRNPSSMEKVTDVSLKFFANGLFFWLLLRPISLLYNGSFAVLKIAALATADIPLISHGVHALTQIEDKATLKRHLQHDIAAHAVCAITDTLLSGIWVIITIAQVVFKPEEFNEQMRKMQTFINRQIDGGSMRFPTVNASNTFKTAYAHFGLTKVRTNSNFQDIKSAAIRVLSVFVYIQVLYLAAVYHAVRAAGTLGLLILQKNLSASGSNMRLINDADATKDIKLHAIAAIAQIAFMYAVSLSYIKIALAAALLITPERVTGYLAKGEKTVRGFGNRLVGLPADEGNSLLHRIDPRNLINP